MLETDLENKRNLIMDVIQKRNFIYDLARNSVCFGPYDLLYGRFSLLPL